MLSSNWGSKVTPRDIKTILISLNSKKASGIDKIPIKLDELSCDVLDDSR